MSTPQCAPDCRCSSCSEGPGGRPGSRMPVPVRVPLLVLVLLASARPGQAHSQPQHGQPQSSPCVPRASPRTATTPLWRVAGTPRGYYGHDVGYGSYFPVGLDPLTILAGLAFLAFIIQTLYLLLYKHYGLGIGAGVGAGVGIGPLSADRHQRHEQQAWASSIANSIETAAQTYESDAASSEHRTDSGSDAALDSAESRSEPGVAARQLGPSPLDALLAMLRRSWTARTCGSSWLCRLVHFARMLTEPLGTHFGQRRARRGALRARRRAWRDS